MVGISTLRTLVNNGWTIANRRAVTSQIGKTQFEEIAALAKKKGLANDVFEFKNAKSYLEPQNIESTTELLSKYPKVTPEMNLEADNILNKLKDHYYIENIERNNPEIVEEVLQGNITTQGGVEYSRYKTLEKFRNEHPDTFLLFGSEKGSAYDLKIMMTNYGNEPIKIAKEMPVEEIKKTFAEIDNFAEMHDFEPEFSHYMNMLIMKHYNPKTYNHLLTTSNPIEYSFVELWGADWRNAPSPAMLKNITPEQIHTMGTDKIYQVKGVGAYVDSSDGFMKDKKAVQELSEQLSKFKISHDVELYRGEKTVGMFDSISLDKDFEKQIRQLLETNKSKAQNAEVTSYIGSYSVGPDTNLYDFLSSKENLTLADAMQVAKYGDEKFVDEIIRRIKDSKVVDTRFKSLSFDEGMARGWRQIHRGDNTTIVQRATVKEGTQGGFHQGNNAQYEVILNNTPKEMRFKDAAYNKEEDTFELNTLIQNI